MTGRLPMALAGAALLALPAAGARAQDCQYEYPAPVGPKVVVTGSGPDHDRFYVEHQAELSTESSGAGETVPGSTVFTITPEGGSPVQVRESGRYGGASYTLPKIGSYTVTASWRAVRCQYGNTFWDVTTPPVTFRATDGRPPIVAVSTFRVRRGAHTQGSATLLVDVICPGSSASRRGIIEQDLWWSLGGAVPTHASRHLGSRSSAEGCLSPGRAGGPRPPSLTRPGYHLTPRQVVARSPTTLRVLIEVRERGVLLKRVRATFRPVASGEVVRLG